MINLTEQARFIVLTGNYGSGKTELALNLAMRFAEKEKTTLVDLDIVNPYFRSGEKTAMLQEAGVRVYMPTFALTTVDIPALPAEIQSVFESDAQRVIFDVGGDDTGAAALGRYYPSFMRFREDTQTVLVVNCMRPLTRTAEQVAELAERIQARGRLKLDWIINNTNLAQRTTPDMLQQGEQTVLEAAKKLNIQQVATSGKADLIRKAGLTTPVLTIERYMVPEWMEDESE